MTASTDRRNLADLLRDACAKPRRLLTPGVGSAKLLDQSGVIIRPQIVNAQRFLLDKDVAELAASIGALKDPLGEGRTRDGIDWDDPAMLLLAMPRCRAPYANTWVEWPVVESFMFTDPETLEIDYEALKTAPLVMGTFVEELPDFDARYRITAVYQTPGGREFPKSVVVSPASVICDLTLDVPRTPEHQIAMDDDHDGWFETLMLGKAWYNATTTENKEAIEACRSICRRATLAWSPFTGHRVQSGLKQEDYHKLLHEVIKMTLKVESTGLLRIVLGALVLINSRASDLTTWSVVGDGNWSDGGKLRQNTYRRYLDHNTVRLTVPREKAVQILGKSWDYEFGRRRRHPVRGSWCHARTGERAGNPNCIHEFDTTDPLRQKCTQCGAARWWRAEHERGDAGLGYVTHDYDVRASA